MPITKHLRKNQEIRSPRVLLIEGDEKVGDVSLEVALARAAEKGLDLVEVAPMANPPVCRLMDYAAHVYNEKKKDKKNRKGQKKTETKTVRLSIGIDTHDLEVKANQAKRFLADRNIVKVALIFRGREITHKELGYDKMKLFFELLDGVAVKEQEPKMQAYQMIMILNPAK